MNADQCALSLSFTLISLASHPIEDCFDQRDEKREGEGRKNDRMIEITKEHLKISYSFYTMNEFSKVLFNCDNLEEFFFTIYPCFFSWLCNSRENSF